MARKKSGGGFGCLIVIGITVWLFAEHPTWAWIGVLIIIVLGVLMSLGSRTGSCQVCGAALKKTKYTWDIKGEQKTVCPTCNRRLQNKRSKQAVDELLSEDS